MERSEIIAYFYLLAAALFIWGLKQMSSPATARRGNLLSGIGMLIAIVATLFEAQVISYWQIALGIVVGGSIGTFMARTVKMTAMPQMVALLNGFGGAASALVAGGEFFRTLLTDGGFQLGTSVAIVLGVLIGSVTFTGSVMAFAKLQELVQTRPITYRFQNQSNLLLFLAIVGMMVYLVVAPSNWPLFIVLVLATLVLGVLLVIPIGGADMPVVISLLNSYSGVAAAVAGFVFSPPNLMLVIAGMLVGAAGLILTQLMSKAMNRSLANIFFGAFGKIAPATAGGRVLSGDHTIREATPEDVAILLSYAQNAIIVPGYGLAVAQAQHEVAELAKLLEQKGVNVKFAIHPVAGRMPGHMNVLLAEANVPYDKLYDLEQINPEFDRTDVVLVVGANDVVNPAARNVPDSPIYGMPILNVDHAKNIVVLKRSMNPGFAGIENDLFYNPKTRMLFGDAKKSVASLIAQVKNMQ